MLGYSSNTEELPPSLRNLEPNVLWYDRSNSWEFIKIPTEPVLERDELPVPPFESNLLPRSHSPKNSSGFGPEVFLGAALADRLPQKIALVKYARSGTNLYGHWNPNLENSLYHRMMDRVRLAIADLSAQGYSVEIAGFFWMQGEADAKNDIKKAESYESNLTNLIQHLRQEFDDSNLPFICGLIPVTSGTKTEFGVFKYGDIVREAQEKIATSIPHTSIVETKHLPKADDNLHLNAEGLVELGRDFAEAWFQEKDK